MSNYINVTFSCNEYYLMAKLLTDSYKIKDILNDSNPEYLNTMSQEKRQILLIQFNQFINIAQILPAIQSLLNFGADFDNVPDEQKGSFNEAMFTRLEKISNATDAEQLAKYENSSIVEAFEVLKNTAFFTSIKEMTNKHKQELQRVFEENRETAETRLQPLLGNLPEKQMDILVLPPEIFDTQVTLQNKGSKVKSVASYPNYFEQGIHNSAVVAMIHEIMHTYIPLDKERHFSNETQKLVYNVINHCLVELSSNCELGIPICGLDSYFQMPMHNEILKHNFTDNTGIKKDFYRSQDINFPKEFEFESTSQYGSIVHGKTVTPKDELSNDKIRGIIYPYFLAYKNKRSENPIEAITQEISRDKKAIISIYGEKFYEFISSKSSISKAIFSIEKAKDLLQLNDIIAEQVFGIELEQKKQVSSSELRDLWIESLRNWGESDVEFPSSAKREEAIIQANQDSQRQNNVTQKKPEERDL